MTENVKQALADLVHTLPDDCTWDDVMYRIYVKQKIATGIQAAENGEVIAHDEVFAEFEDNDSNSVD